MKKTNLIVYQISKAILRMFLKIVSRLSTINNSHDSITNFLAERILLDFFELKQKNKLRNINQQDLEGFMLYVQNENLEAAFK